MLGTTLLRAVRRCAVTGSSLAVDGCHVIPRCAGHNLVRQLSGDVSLCADDASNIIPLNPALHRLYDKYCFSFVPNGDGTYHIESYISDPIIDQHLGRDISLMARPEFLAAHRTECHEKRKFKSKGGMKVSPVLLDMWRDEGLRLLSMNVAGGVMTLRLSLKEDENDSTKMEKYTPPQNGRAIIEHPVSKTLEKDGVPKQEFSQQNGDKNKKFMDQNEFYEEEYLEEPLPKDKKLPIRHNEQSSTKNKLSSLIEAMKMYPELRPALLGDCIASQITFTMALFSLKEGRNGEISTTFSTKGFLEYMKINRVDSRNWKSATSKICETFQEGAMLRITDVGRVKSILKIYQDTATSELASLPSLIESCLKEANDRDNVRLATMHKIYIFAAVMRSPKTSFSDIYEALSEDGVISANFTTAITQHAIRFLVARSGPYIIRVADDISVLEPYRTRLEPYMRKFDKYPDIKEDDIETSEIGEFEPEPQEEVKIVKHEVKRESPNSRIEWARKIDAVDEGPPLIVFVSRTCPRDMPGRRDLIVTYLLARSLLFDDPTMTHKELSVCLQRHCFPPVAVPRDIMKDPRLNWSKGLVHLAKSIEQPPEQVIDEGQETGRNCTVKLEQILPSLRKLARNRPDYVDRHDLMELLSGQEIHLGNLRRDLPHYYCYPSGEKILLSKNYYKKLHSAS